VSRRVSHIYADSHEQNEGKPPEPKQPGIVPVIELEVVEQWKKVLGKEPQPDTDKFAP